MDDARPNISAAADGLIEGADPTIAARTGRIDVRCADTTPADLAAGGSPVGLELADTLSTQAKLVLTAHEVDLPEPKELPASFLVQEAQ